MPGKGKEFRQTVTITQCDREGEPLLVWTVVNAWPNETSVYGDLDAEASNNSIETMVLSHEGFGLSSAPGNSAVLAVLAAAGTISIGNLRVLGIPGL